MSDMLEPIELLALDFEVIQKTKTDFNSVYNFFIECLERLNVELPKKWESKQISDVDFILRSYATITTIEELLRVFKKEFESVFKAFDRLKTFRDWLYTLKRQLKEMITENIERTDFYKDIDCYLMDLAYLDGMGKDWLPRYKGTNNE